MIYTLVNKDFSGNIDAIFSFDSITSFDEDWSATVTTQTVEDGFDISDNINIEAPTYSISGIISEYSLFNKDREILWYDGDFYTQYESDVKNAHVVARDNLIAIFKNRSLLTIIESENNSNNTNPTEKEKELKSGYNNEIENCVITSLSISTPSSGSGAFMVSMKIQKINVARVLVLELMEGEKSPLLTEFVTKPTSTASKTNTSESVSEDGEVLIQPKDVALQSSDVKGEKISTGRNWFDVNAENQVVIGAIEDRIKIEEEMREHIAKYGVVCRIKEEGGALIRNCTAPL